jgi:hypothetical protein
MLAGFIHVLQAVDDRVFASCVSFSDTDAISVVLF